MNNNPTIDAIIMVTAEPIGSTKYNVNKWIHASSNKCYNSRE